MRDDGLGTYEIPALPCPACSVPRVVSTSACVQCAGCGMRRGGHFWNNVWVDYLDHAEFLARSPDCIPAARMTCP